MWRQLHQIPAGCSRSWSQQTRRPRGGVSCPSWRLPADCLPHWGRRQGSRLGPRGQKWLLNACPFVGTWRKKTDCEKNCKWPTHYSKIPTMNIGRLISLLSSAYYLTYLPEKYFIDIDSSSSNQFSAGVCANAAELCGPRWSERSKVPVSGRVKGPHSSVQRRWENHLAVGNVDDAGNGRSVLTKSDIAKAGNNIPEFDFAVFATSGNRGSIYWKIGSLYLKFLSYNHY